MNEKSHQAHCFTELADGRKLTVTATRRPRGNRSDVKCAVPGIGPRVQEVVRLARLTEASCDTRDQVVIDFDQQPGEHERNWELAAVLADRLVRGAWQSRTPPKAMGWSDAWELGRIDGGASGLAHLGQLTGQGAPGAAVSSARTWFPLHSGGSDDSLCWVEVSVHPLDGPPLEEEDSISAPGLDAAQQLQVRRVLAAARRFDAHGLGRWRTVVRFGERHFTGNSYELALVMADRLARGREFPCRGRLLATGCSAAWHQGRVDVVDARSPKLALLEREALPGDRILLPLAWREDAAGVALRARGASLAWVDKIGII